MTADVKTVLRVWIDQASRLRAEAELRRFGFDSCDRCQTALDPHPGRRFCSENCRKRWADHQTRLGRSRRAVLKKQQQLRRLAA